ncbi:MAG TPA: MtrB/PioB family decaheme-associated outer membrane protein [Vicinamibacterales bacterium]|nr:MtrB/PioB family decaheme-associated outer membrane protein [Vicinamibacterales bacterium]
MRRILIVAGALLLSSPGLTLAQQAQTLPATSRPPDVPAAHKPAFGLFDFGYRAEDISGDRARYNRFRDTRDGLYVNRFTVQKETDNWFARGFASNIGYRDQRFGGSIEDIGRLKVAFAWDQVPLFISNTTRTLHTDRGNGILEVDDAIQRGIQTGALTLANAVAQARPFDIRSRRDVGRFDMTYTLNRDVDLLVNVRNTQRTGHNIMTFGLGTSPGLNPIVEMGVPTDDRTTDVSGRIEYANARGLLSVGYTGSWYENSIPTVRFDNPLRIDNINNGAAVGQAVLWPSNSSFSVHANGAYKLGRRTRASAALSVGRLTQNEPLAAPTSNTALVAPTLPRGTAEAQADVRSVNLNLSSRPVPTLWLNARYRYYDYDNKTHHYEVRALVGDWTVGTVNRHNEPASYTRGTLDLDASYAPVDFLTFGVGYGNEKSDRTYRIFEETTENVWRATVDTRGNQYVSFRAKYEHAKREGSGFDLHLLEEVGEQPTMRHYDVADRKRVRLSGMLTVTPVQWLSVNGSVSDGNDDYTSTGFGLRDNDNRAYSVGLDLVPVNTVTFGVNYGSERYTAQHWARSISQAPGTAAWLAQWNDPNRDVWTDQDDKVKTVTASLDLIKTIPKMDIRLSYDVSDGTASYVYNLRPTQTLFTTTPLIQLPQVKNEVKGSRVDARYFVRANVALGVGYWYEKYAVDDFAFAQTTITALNLPSAVYTGYLFSPYTAHSGWVRISYLW